MRLTALIIVLTLGASVGPARAGHYFKDDSEKDEITYQLDKPRTPRQRLLIGSLLAGAVIFAGVGAYFHLDSSDKASAVEAVDLHTGRVYTEELDDTRRGALSSRRWAIAGYSAGALMLAGTAVAFALTQPGKERITVGDERQAPAPIIPVSVTMLPGGALVGGAWSF